MWYLCTMEYYSAIKRNRIICRDVDGPRDRVKSKREKEILYTNIVYVESIKNGVDHLPCKAEIRDTGRENKYIDTTGRKVEWDELGDWD